MAKTKAQIQEALDELGIEYSASALKPELEQLLDDAAEVDELEERRSAAPKCNSCGRSRLDGHIHSGR